MYLNIPGEILNIYGSDPLARIASVSFGGIIKEFSLAYTPRARIGDYVLVHSNFVVGIIDDEEAQRILAYPEESQELESQDDSSPL
ncbi:HypC/HybG/HupF family hydrogenase formation chaperone [Verrucomicrobiota bacterium sgz303538]